MRRLSIKWLVTVLVLLCGCGGGTRTLRLPSTSTSGPPPQDLNIPGNWELATRSTLGVSALAIAGSIIQSGSTLSGAVHLDGSSCFEQATAIGLTGTLTDGNISLTSAPVNDIIISLTGTITKRDGYPYQLNGTYTTDGGCAGGDQGNVIGYSVDGISGPWNGNLTTGGGADILGHCPVGPGWRQLRGQLWPNREFYFRRCLLQFRAADTRNVSHTQLHLGYVHGV